MRTVLFAAALFVMAVGVVGSVVVFYAGVTAWPVGVALVIVLLLGVVLAGCGAAVRKA